MDSRQTRSRSRATALPTATTLTPTSAPTAPAPAPARGGGPAHGRRRGNGSFPTRGSGRGTGISGEALIGHEDVLEDLGEPRDGSPLFFPDMHSSAHGRAIVTNRIEPPVVESHSELLAPMEVDVEATAEATTGTPQGRFFVK